MAAKSAAVNEKVVDEGLIVKALATAVAVGDIVNFRLLFSPFSPSRTTSTERFETEKYAYLLPDRELESTKRFTVAVSEIRKPFTWSHIKTELAAKRPPRLPSDLLMLLADNAVALGKYTSAAQAYESLRMRRRMQQEFFELADEALDANDIPKAVRGYRIAAGLAYDYAAFPEPLPLVPKYQTEALKLHGEYPTRPEDCVALFEPDGHVNTGLGFLLYDPEASGRLVARPFETRLAFLQELVRQIDPEWDAFVARYLEACERVRAFGKRLEKQAALTHGAPESLEEEIEQQRAGDEPKAITIGLLGREIENGEWWQYLKELAYEHPASVLFIARQAVGDSEILMPRMRAASPLPPALGLAAADAENGSERRS